MNTNSNTLKKFGQSFTDNDRKKGLSLRANYLAIHFPGQTWYTLDLATKTKLCDTLPWRDNN